jgi:NAD(P)-dependent dehydrogenase (short-subunit alcohol dehydrogenase family)
VPPLAGQSVLITGAGHGIGAEVARRLAAHRARVALVGLGGDDLRRAAADCPGSVVFEADVTDRDALDGAVARTVERFGGIDAVLANAGIGAGGPFRTTDPGVYERVIDVNLLGVVRTVQACLPQILERRGYLLLVASVAAINNAFPFATNYAVAKAGVEALGNGLRLELKHHGVDVGVAYFSWIGTDLVHGTDAHAATQLFRSRLKGPFGRTYPVSLAADAIAAGVERRSRVVVAPRWVKWMLPVRGLLPYVADREALAIVPEAERLFEQHGGAVGGPGSQAGLRGRDAVTPG